MVVEHAFTVNAPSERVLAALLDLPTSVACLPCTRLLAVSGDSASGRIRFPPGSAATAYQGTLRLVECDPEARSLRAVLQGTAPQGGGTASGVIELRLRESNGLTTASLRGELEVDGRPPTLEPDALQRAAVALLRRFGRSLENSMARGAEPGARVDPGERLEETIAALNQLERVTTTGSPVGRGSTRPPVPPPSTDQLPPGGKLSAVQERPAVEEGPRPVPGPPDRRVRGRVEVVTIRPVPVPRNPTRRERVGDRIDDRPWMVPGVLLSGLMMWLLCRRRE